MLCDDGGQSLVEFALSSVVFLMTIFGTLELGLAVWRYNMVADLAQEGARWAIVRGAQSSMPASTTDVQNFVLSRANGVPVSSVTTTPAPSTLIQGQTVTVVVRSNYLPLTGLIPQAAITLQSTAQMVMSR